MDQLIPRCAEIDAAINQQGTMLTLHPSQQVGRTPRHSAPHYLSHFKHTFWNKSRELVLKGLISNGIISLDEITELARQVCREEAMSPQLELELQAAAQPSVFIQKLVHSVSVPIRDLFDAIRKRFATKIERFVERQALRPLRLFAVKKEKGLEVIRQFKAFLKLLVFHQVTRIPIRLVQKTVKPSTRNIIIRSFNPATLSNIALLISKKNCEDPNYHEYACTLTLGQSTLLHDNRLLENIIVLSCKDFAIHLSLAQVTEKLLQRIDTLLLLLGYSYGAPLLPDVARIVIEYDLPIHRCHIRPPHLPTP